MDENLNIVFNIVICQYNIQVANNFFFWFLKMIIFHTINVRSAIFIQFELKYNKYTHLWKDLFIRNHLFNLHIKTGPVYKLYPKWDRHGTSVPLAFLFSYF